MKRVFRYIAVVLLVGMLCLPAVPRADQVQYIYDDLGRLSQVIDEQGNVAIYTYDAVGNLISITRQTGGAVALPRITAINPGQSPAGTTLTVTFTGENLTGATVSTDNPGITVSNVVVADPTTVTATFALGASLRAGPATVLVTTPTGVASTIFQVGPVIISLSPTSGPPTRLVTITTNGPVFSPTLSLNQVSFNGVAATVIAATVTTLTTAVPAGATTGSVTVTVGGLTSNGLPFTVATPSGAAPTLTAITPNTGTFKGGTSVTLTGSGFIPGTSVLIGGVLTTSTIIQNATSIRVTTPSGTRGPANVLVSNVNGDAFLLGGYTYVGLVVRTVTPAESAANVPLNAPIQVQFSEAVAPSTVTSGSAFLMLGNTIVPAPITLQQNNTVAQLKTPASLQANTAYAVTITRAVTDTTGNQLDAVFTSSFTTGSGTDTVRPTLTAGSPRHDAAATSGAVIRDIPVNAQTRIRFSEPINPISFSLNPPTIFSPFSFYLTSPFGAVPTTLSFGPDRLTAILTPSQPLLGGTSYSVNLFHEMRDVADNRVRLDPFNPFQSGLGWAFTTNGAIDTTPPQVMTLSPSNGETGVPPNFKLRVEFSEPIASPTVTSQAVVVKKGSAILPGAFTFEQNGRVVKWTPSSPLPINSTMTVTVTGDILDLAGNPLAAPVAGSFTTTQFQDTAPPTVTSVSPVNGASAVPTTSHVVLTFSETIDPITVTPTALSSDGFILPGTFSLEGGAAVYPGSVSVAADRKTFTLTPTFRLFAGQTYFVRRSTCCLEDLAGNALGSTIESSFTTALAAGTDVNAQPAAATVVANSPRIFADGQATSTVTISNIHRNGMAVPDGTLIAVTADRVYMLHNTSLFASDFSYGGTILGGTPSPVDPRFRLFPTQGGSVTLTYRTPRLTGSNIEQAFIQVTNTDAGGASMSLIGSAGITLVTRRTAFPAANPTSVLANGTAVSEITIPIEEFEFFNNGAPVASGYQFAVTAAPVFNLTSAGGTINGGTVAPDSRFKLFTTGPGGVATITYTPPAFPAAQTGTAVIQVAAVDEAGNVVGFLGSTNISLSGSSGFTSPQPVVVSASPANGQMEVATNAAVVAKFSQPLDPATVTSSTFSITIFGSPVAGARTLSSSEFGANTVVTFRPTSPFASNTTFNVSITTGIRSATGNPLLISRFTTFSTGATSDTVAPTVQQVSPPTGLTEAPTNAVVSVALSEPISAVSVSSTTFTVSAGGVPVNGRRSLSIGDRGPNSIVTFIPDQPLAPATLYTVAVNAGITDVAENPLAAFSSNFTTGSSSETVQPTVLGVSPSSGQTGVPLNAQVTLQFSERINPVTITTMSFNVAGGPDASTVAGTFVMASDLSSVSFVPSQPLLPNTEYAVTITRDIQDLAGNPLLLFMTNPTATSDTWLFITGS